MIRVFAAFLITAAVTAPDATTQIRITKAERLPLSASQQWSQPQFSPQGSALYYTNLQGNGIWEYSFRTRSARQLTADARSGAAFSVSPDGRQIVYRRSLTDTKGRPLRQEIVLLDLPSRAQTLLASGTDLSLPTFANNVPVYSVRSETKNLSKSQRGTEITILGIENTKIALNRNGTKVLLDPMGKGSYIWPALSPGRNQIVAYEMDRGAFVCDLDGRVITKLGKRDAPSWTRTGNWIVYMEDKDDGHQILSSDLWAVTPDGKSVTQLTSTKKIFEMYPQCSPTENSIACSTLNGQIYILRYEEK